MALYNLQQKYFSDEIQKNKMQIGSLETTAMKQEHDYRKVLRSAKDRKKQIRQLNTKVIQLQDQLKIKEIQLQDKVKINEKLQFENKVLKEKLASKSYKEDEFLKLVGDLHMDLRQRESSLKELLESYPTLTIKDSESNEMLQNGLKELTEDVIKEKSNDDMEFCLPLSLL